MGETDFLLTLYVNDVIRWLASDIQAVTAFKEYLYKTKRTIENDPVSPDDIMDMFKSIDASGHLHVSFHPS